MFDIGFSELLVIAVVALIVIGPERLPKVARTAGHLFGRLQRYVNDVKADIAREMELDELKKLRTSMEETARSFEQSVENGLRETESELNSVAQSTRAGVDAEARPESGHEEPSAAQETPAAPASQEPGPALDPRADGRTHKPA